MFQEQYEERMREFCGNPAECKFPQSYFGNLRIWDYERIMEHGDFKPTDEVLECGALHSYFCIYLSQFVKQYQVGDSFYWYNRSYNHPNTHQSPEEWCKYCVEKGRGKLLAEEADIQKLQYPDDYFDKVISISTIEHVHEDRKGMTELLRVLKPGGLLLITTEYNPTWYKPYSEEDDSYYRVYDEKNFNELVKGLNVEYTQQHMPVNKGEFTTLFVKIRK